MLKLDKISDVLWEITQIGNMLLQLTKLYVPKYDFPMLLNFVDVQRQTKTSLDAHQEATIDDYWKMDGDQSVSEPWIGAQQI